MIGQALLDECKDNKVDPDQNYPDTYDDVDGVAAEFGDLSDLLAKSSADGAENDEGDAESYGIDEYGEKALEGGLIEGDVGENDEEHRSSSSDGDRSKGEAEKECAKYGVCIGQAESIEDAADGWFVEMEELESHGDHEDAAKDPGNGAVEVEDMFAEESGEEPEREEGEDGSYAEGDDEFEYRWKGEGGFSAREVADEPKTDDTVAGANSGEEAKDEDPGDGWVEYCGHRCFYV